MLGVVIFSITALMSGVAHLEAITYGTDYFVHQGDINPLGDDLREHMEAKAQTEAFLNGTHPMQQQAAAQ